LETAESQGKPQSEEFRKQEGSQASVMANPENGYETGASWIEDCPAPEMQVMAGGGGIEKRMESLLDSGSEVNVISRVAAEDFKGNWKTLKEVGERSWSMRTANGSRTKVEWCVELSVRLGKSKRRGVRFYVVEGVPVELVIGNGSMTRWGVVLDWKRRTVSFDMGGGEETMEWKKKGQQNWRHPITLIANRDYDVPPGYQMVIGVEEIRNEEFKGYSTKEGW
jgi:hypothetical protein